MSVPRFVPITGSSAGGVPIPTWPGGGEPFAGQVAKDGGWVAWRLLGGNNRELGRSAEVFATALECASAVRALATEIPAAKRTVTVDLATGLWHWHLSIQGRRFAASARRYSRQRECHYSMDQFITIARATAPTFAASRWARGGGERPYLDIWTRSGVSATEGDPRWVAAVYGRSHRDPIIGHTLDARP